jgi:glycosyltransferase involved in cell wall biosynthesis
MDVVKCARHAKVITMNILFLSELFFPHGGGAELATYEYAKLLSENGINVIVVTNKFSSEPSFSKNQKLVIYRLPLMKGSSTVKYQILFNFNVVFSNFFRKLFAWADVVYIPRFWFSAIPVAKAYGKPVLVHLHDYILICPLASMYDLSRAAICQSGHCSQKCIYTFEQNFGRSLKSSLASTLLNSTLGPQLRRLITLSNGIVCVSNAQKNIIISKIPTLRNKIRVIYNPLPECCFTKIEGDDYGFLGGSNPVKGFDVLHCALTEITSNIHVKLHVTKFALPHNEPELLDHAEIVYHSKLSPASLNNLYKQIRAVCFPSIWPEPLPYVVSETILKGRLVIASDIGGSPELAEGCKGAFFFEPGNVKELAEKIEYVAKLSREVAIDFAAQGRETLLKKFNNEIILSRFIDVCHTLVETTESDSNLLPILR